MEQTRNNRFGSKIHILLLSALVFTCVRVTKIRARYFLNETIVVSFLHLMVLLFKVLFNHSESVIIDKIILHIKQKSVNLDNN